MLSRWILFSFVPLFNNVLLFVVFILQVTGNIVNGYFYTNS